jgi:diguanylate cyclase (GGDEF)-like protein
MDMSDSEAQINAYKEEIKDLRELIEIGKSLNSNLKYSTLLDCLLLSCMGRAMVTKAGLFIRHEIDSKEFTLYRNYEGFSPDKNIKYVIEDKSEIINSLLLCKGCLTMPELLENIKDISHIKPFTFLEPSLIIPIVMKSDLQGIIVLGDKISGTSFNQKEKSFLRNVADLGAIAINNTFLLQVSSTDMMTKLKMRHILFQTLTEICSGSNVTMSLLMIDIDHFKAVNDTYGHSFGDIVIKEIASIILKNIRIEDIAARYGGEEFTVVLRSTPKDIAENIAERIRKTIEQTEFSSEDIKIHTTISIGIAQFNPQLDIIPQDLIKRADTALYQAKESGRNRIMQA